MTSPAIPQRSKEPVPEPIPQTVIPFLKDLIADPLVETLLPQAVEDVQRLAGRVFGGTILTFSTLAARIGQLLPGGLNVTESTLSAEVARRNNVTVRGAHALMLREDVNSRGVNGLLARAIINIDMRGADRNDLFDVIRVLPKGTFRAKWKKRLRELNKSLKVPEILRRLRGDSN